MKILYVITRAERGGAQSHVLTLLRLQRFGDAMLAVGEEGLLADQARSEGVPVFLLPSLARAVHPWRDLLAVWQLVRLVRSQSPDLIHAHTAKAGMLARIAGRLTRTPTVYTAHCWSFMAAGSALARCLSLWLERVIRRFGQAVIDVSQSSFEMAERRRVALGGNHLVIWNGLPDNSLRASPGRGAPTGPCQPGNARDELASAEASGVVEIVMVARFAPQKDHELLLEALSLLPHGWRCSFVGSGPEQGRVEARAHALGLRERVCFLGDRGDVSEILARSHLFVLSTKYEGLPISIIEAMRAGLPVIATGVDGCGELVTDARTGYLTKPGDVLSLRNALDRLISSPKLREQFGRAGRRRFEADFLAESMVRKTEAAYERIVTDRRTGASMEDAVVSEVLTPAGHQVP